MSESSDAYPYPGTDVLRNIPGIRNAKDLIAFEALNSGARMYELRLRPKPGNFETAHLKATLCSTAPIICRPHDTILLAMPAISSCEIEILGHPNLNLITFSVAPEFLLNSKEPS